MVPVKIIYITIHGHLMACIISVFVQSVLGMIPPFDQHRFFFCSMGSSQNENIIYGVARVDRSSRIKSQASWDVDLGAQINCSQPKKSHGSRVDRSY